MGIRNDASTLLFLCLSRLEDPQGEAGEDGDTTDVTDDRKYVWEKCHRFYHI